MSIYVRNDCHDKMDWTTEELNCGSFALDTDLWFHPYNNYDEDIDERDICDVWTYDDREYDATYYYNDEDYSLEEVYSYILEKDAEEIELVCPWVRRCDPKECEDGRRMIAYRIGFDEDALFNGHIDGDFHFRLRDRDGFWYEKNGCKPAHILCDSDDEPWECGSNTYDSEIIYFCFREDDK